MIILAHAGRVFTGGAPSLHSGGVPGIDLGRGGGGTSDPLCLVSYYNNYNEWDKETIGIKMHFMHISPPKLEIVMKE